MGDKMLAVYDLSSILKTLHDGENHCMHTLIHIYTICIYI